MLLVDKFAVGAITHSIFMQKLTITQLNGLFPQYSNIEEIAEGGFKTVYKATLPDGIEALKVVSIPDGSVTDDHQRFRDECIGRVEREVGILNDCHSPYLVKVASLQLNHHTIEGNDFVTYSEEFLPGANLWDILRTATDRPSEAEVKQLMSCLLHAIKELWNLRVIHRDIKPLNVIRLGNQDRPFVLIDLGIAFAIRETALTFNASHRDPVATFRYIAPEQCDPRRRANLDYRTDLYAAALTVFEFATGQHPVARDTDDRMLTVTRALLEPPKRLEALRADFSTPFCRLINQLLNKRPSLRPANIDHLIQLTES